jgi:hypothetical protein
MLADVRHTPEAVAMWASEGVVQAVAADVKGWHKAATVYGCAFRQSRLSLCLRVRTLTC